MDIEKIRHFRKKLRQFELEISGVLKNDRGCCGVTLPQCHILLEIGKKEEMSIVELSSALGLDTSTLSRTIDGMVRIGLVSRKLNPADRRYVSITLAQQGKAVYDSIENTYNNYFSKLFEFIPEEKQKQVVESFVLFADAVKKCKEENQGCGDRKKNKKGESF